MNDVSFSAGYVCGVLCSAGTVMWNERHGNYMLALETKDEGFARLFLESLRTVTGREPHAGFHKRKRGTEIVHMNMVTLYSRTAVEGLVNVWGLSFGTRSWLVPKPALVDAVFRRGFLTGFCDGNGSISSGTTRSGNKTIKTRSLKIYSVNRAGLSGVRGLFDMEGVRSLFHKAGKCFAISVNGKTRLHVFSSRVGFARTDKKRRLEEVLLSPSASGHEVAA